MISSACAFSGQRIALKILRLLTITEGISYEKLPSIHPSDQRREEFILPLGLSSNVLARALNATPTRLDEIVPERRGIGADTALRLARFFNTSN